jgi:hypothetical protein
MSIERHDLKDHLSTVVEHNGTVYIAGNSGGTNEVSIGVGDG